MPDYRLTGGDVIVRISDGASIPNDPGNRDRRAYEEWRAAGGIPEPYEVSITGNDVDIERDRRIATLFTFGDVSYQLDADSQRYITAKGAQAKFAVAAGAQPEDLRWADPGHDFGWISTNNSVTPMDAQTMAAFADAADLWVTAHIMAGHALKTMTPIPADYADDKWWP